MTIESGRYKHSYLDHGRLEITVSKGVSFRLSLPWEWPPLGFLRETSA